MTLEPVTNFKDSNGVDLGNKLITKDYLISVYPEIGQEIGIPPELYTWGVNNSGQLGDNTVVTLGSNKSIPAPTFAGGTDWKQVSAGFNHTAAVKTDGTLWTWGDNTSGQLGNNDTTIRSTPVTTFAGGTDWKQVSAAYNHTAAIKTDGTLWTWGQGNSGQLGNNGTNGKLTPVTTFAGGTDWKLVNCGFRVNFAIKNDGTLWGWGDNGGAGPYSLLGIGVSTGNRLTPVTTFAGGTNWKQVSSDNTRSAAIKTDGTLWVWGGNSSGQLGTNDSVSRSTPVTTFIGGTDWKQVDVKEGGSIYAIKTNGTLWTANGEVTSIGFTGSNWKQLALAIRKKAAIKTDGTLWEWDVPWGSGSTPTPTLAGGTNWKQVDVGTDGNTNHIVAIRSVDF